MDACLRIEVSLLSTGELALGNTAIEEPIYPDQARSGISWSDGNPDLSRLREFFDRTANAYLAFHIYPRDGVDAVLRTIRTLKQAVGQRLVPELYLENPK